jgi:hypothetical protein
VPYCVTGATTTRVFTWCCSSQLSVTAEQNAFSTRVQVLTSENVKRTAFWEAPNSPLKADRRFWGAYCLHHRPDDWGSTQLCNVCLLLRDYTALLSQKVVIFMYNLSTLISQQWRKRLLFTSCSIVGCTLCFISTQWATKISVQSHRLFQFRNV